jgi:hypothetical protein
LQGESIEGVEKGGKMKLFSLNLSRIKEKRCKDSPYSVSNLICSPGNSKIKPIHGILNLTHCAENSPSQDFKEACIDPIPF